jgi:hypothetical protein
MSKLTEATRTVLEKIILNIKDYIEGQKRLHKNLDTVMFIVNEICSDTVGYSTDGPFKNCLHTTFLLENVKPNRRQSLLKYIKDNVEQVEKQLEVKEINWIYDASEDEDDVDFNFIYAKLNENFDSPSMLLV